MEGAEARSLNNCNDAATFLPMPVVEVGGMDGSSAPDDDEDSDGDGEGDLLRESRRAAGVVFADSPLGLNGIVDALVC